MSLQGDVYLPVVREIWPIIAIIVMVMIIMVVDVWLPGWWELACCLSENLATLGHLLWVPQAFLGNALMWELPWRSDSVDIITTNTHSMVSNETVLMCDEASVTNEPLCIPQSPQIINQLDGQFWKMVSTYY